MKSHEVHVFENGTVSIRNTELGETMHSRVGPDEEARLVHVEQSGLQTSLAEGGNLPLVLFDVGMGIASNALAAVEVARSFSRSRPLHIVSFENSLEGLELALSHSEQFPLQSKYEEVLSELLKTHRWEDPSGKILWELKLGDFMEQRLEPAPEIIFYDFYSPKSSPHLWTKRCFDRLFEACAPRREQRLSTVLTTYSVATFVRSAMLLAGFAVGYGIATHLKSGTTFASTDFNDLKKPLDEAWLEKLVRSSKPLPPDIPSPDIADALERIRSTVAFRTPA